MNYHILKRVTDQGGTYYTSIPSNIVATTPEALQTLAREQAAKHPNETLFLVQEIGKVSIEPVVTMTLAPPTPPPHQVYRGGMMSPPEVELAEEGPKRDPQVKPRLLIVDRKATPAELVGHLMVVADGHIVKNAFGALELEDMPLQGTEVQEVANALRRNLVV
jgi:hypothetical protein